MTREEVIAELNVLHERLSNPKDCEDGCYSWEDGWYVEAIDMAIEALKAEPIRCGECENYIDRRCIEANHHVAAHGNCMNVFGAKRREL